MLGGDVDWGPFGPAIARWERLTRPAPTPTIDLGGKPKLSDLRDSGSIEQDADLVMFIHQNDEDIRDETGRVKEVQRKELIIAKHRNGPLGAAILDYHTRFNTFVEIDYTNYGSAEADFQEI